MNIGFIGTGRMGNPMVRKLLSHGHNVTIHDLSRESAIDLEELGAKWVSSPKSASEGNTIIFTSLPGPVEIQEVACGKESIIEGISARAIYVDLSTNSPDSIRGIEKDFGSIGANVLDAPVSGGVTGAETGTLSIMVGGREQVFEEALPVLECIGATVIYCGAIGSGMVAKICNNLLTLGLSCLLSEALTLGKKAGVELDILTKAISAGSGKNWVLDNKLPKTVFQGNFAAGFETSLAAKDLHLATDLGYNMQIPMELTNIIEQRYIEAMGQDLHHEDSDIVFKIYEKRSGIDLRIP